MRTIKFRAWDNQLNQWARGKDLDYANILNFPVNDYFIKDGHEVDRWSFSQFTGLHDKNGKEIYEGDIVNSHANFELPYFREVVYDRCGLTFKPQTGFILCKENEFHFDVIGNIYQNPELLTP